MCNDRASQSEHRVFLYSLLVFVLFSTVFILLRSKDPLEVDGAFRCFAVLRRPELSFGENNHALYPADVFIWTRFAKFAGFNITSLEGFFSAAELMNCFAAAGCLALLFRLSYAATLSNKVALGVVFGFGFTRAFLLHAMNASEPMLGIFWSLLAVYLASRCLRTASPWPAFFSGVFFALALATYQTAVLLGPVAVLILWRAVQPRASSRGIAPKLLKLFTFTVGALTGCIVIYGCIVRYRLHSGAAGVTAASAIHSLFQHPDARAYLGMTFGKPFSLPLGFLRNCYPVLTYFVGIHGFLHGSMLSIGFIFSLLVVLAGLAAYCVVRIAKLWDGLESRTRLAILCGLAGLAFTVIPLVIWDPQYDKFWIQPLTCLIFLLGICLQVISARSTHPIFFCRVVPSVLMVGLLSNFTWVARSHSNSIAEMREARRLSTLVSAGDLVVGSWDGVSVLYEHALAPSGTRFTSFPTDAVIHGPQAVARLRQSVNATLAASGHVFFLGLLDNSRQSWDSFLGVHCGVPYSSFDLYRAHSVPYATFETRYGRVALKQLELGVPSEPR